MKRLAPLLLTLACNQAPLWQDQGGLAPGAVAPWNGPTNDACDIQGGELATIDGFVYCDGEQEPAIPIDDPTFKRCDESQVAPWQDLLYVTDGKMARGYPLEMLSPRKLLHDEWDGEPILVEY